MNELSYEDAILRIKEIVSLLEKNQIGLEKSIELYKEGIKLTNFCKQILDDAEKEVKILIKDENGISYEDFPEMSPLQI